jgi:hypothetical protein
MRKLSDSDDGYREMIADMFRNAIAELACCHRAGLWIEDPIEGMEESARRIAQEGSKGCYEIKAGGASLSLEVFDPAYWESLCRVAEVLLGVVVTPALFYRAAKRASAAGAVSKTKGF